MPYSSGYVSFSPFVPSRPLTRSFCSETGSCIQPLSSSWVSGRPHARWPTLRIRPRVGRYKKARTTYYNHCNVCNLHIAQAPAVFSSTPVIGNAFESTQPKVLFIGTKGFEGPFDSIPTAAGTKLRSDGSSLVLVPVGAKSLSGSRTRREVATGDDLRSISVSKQEGRDDTDRDQSCVRAIVNTTESFHFHYSDTEIQDDGSVKGVTKRGSTRESRSARTPRPRLTTAEEAEIFARISVAVMVGALIGVERRAASANAGIRTLTLVSLGSAIFSLTAMHGFGGDPARMSAAISTGVGFLGSGAINGEIPGGRRQLVTGASIWIAAALGLAAACGLFTLALSGAFLTIWVLRYHLVLTVIVNSFRRSRVLLRKRARQKSINRNDGHLNGSDIEHSRDINQEYAE